MAEGDAWFGGHRGKLLVYRVNRRPFASGDLVPISLPDDAFAHFIDCLDPNRRVTRGRAHKRTWRVGDLRTNETERVLTGRLGSRAAGRGAGPEWSDDLKGWATSHSERPPDWELLPFGFDGESRLLTVLQHGKAAPAIAAVFQSILRDAEKKRPEPTTAWSVEPVLDKQNFLTWLNGAAVVKSVSFTAKLPNPQPKKEFSALWQRIHRAGATKHRETFSSSNENGLRNVDEDTDFKQAIAMGSQGFATLRGEGRNADGATTTYRQTKAVASEHIDKLPDTWDGAWTMITALLKGKLRRFLEDDTA